jgi:hypothetical protein
MGPRCACATAPWAVRLACRWPSKRHAGDAFCRLTAKDRNDLVNAASQLTDIRPSSYG